MAESKAPADCSGVSLLTYHAAIGLYGCLRMQFCLWRPITSTAIT